MRRKLTKEIIRKIELATLTCGDCQSFVTMQYTKEDGTHLLLGGCTRLHQPVRAEDKACTLHMKGENK